MADLDSTQQPVPACTSIMVAVDPSANAANRVRLAAELADRFSARLIGIGAESIVLPLYGPDPTLATKVLKMEEARVKEDLRQAEKIFRREAGKRNRIEWRSGIADPTEFACTNARATDLVIVSRSGPPDGIEHAMNPPASDLIMGLGRPLLILPPDTTHVRARNAMVCWKDTSQARRALRDSLPFLRDAEAVFVVGIGDEVNKTILQDVCVYLSHHGIMGEAHYVPMQDRGTVSDTILEVLQQHDADFLVAGAYGYSRLREWAFGGVTGDLLGCTPVPWLTVH
jgi:nucleotide-binding universal stress UspA family protein